MDSVKIIQLKENILEDNVLKAEALRRRLRQERTFLLNLMSSPGSGKTILILRTLAALSDRKGGVLEADIDSDVDAQAVAKMGTPAVQLHTGGMCHLDAAMTECGLEGLDTAALDYVILENVGNLVCPAEFDTGAASSVMLLSVPEGDDKPLKYPLMFSVCDAVLISKLDCLPYFDFDVEAAERRIRALNPNVKIFPLSAKTGNGLAPWTQWLRSQIDSWNAK